MIKIYKTCENPALFSAEYYSYPENVLEWKSDVSLPEADLIALLFSRGCHQTDIGDALHTIQVQIQCKR